LTFDQFDQEVLGTLPPAEPTVTGAAGPGSPLAASGMLTSVVDPQTSVAVAAAAERELLAPPSVRGRPWGRRVVLVGTYPPTACGLATFTSNLRAAIEAPEERWLADVVRVVDRPEAGGAPYPEVVDEWVAGDLSTLWRSIGTMSRYDAVLLQHEYGLFGGPDGEEVLALVYALEVPLVAVLHTVLIQPKPHQRKVLDAVIRAASAVVVQSEAARQRLVEVHGLHPERVTVVPHGAAANFAPFRSPGSSPLVLTWGLIGPGKGIEHGITAVADLRRRGLDVSYLVAGQTHPKVLAVEGQAYRRSLQELAHRLGVADRVRFDDAYRDWDALRALVRAADVVLMPYDSTDQVSSGVLVEAIASAKPVVATRFPHAVELLSRGAGIVVPHEDPAAIAEAVAHVLFEPGVAEAMSAAAQREATPLLWPAVGTSYRSLVEGVLEREKARL
jgi:glycosyltransferase involved in cell wall biosynthesis